MKLCQSCSTRAAAVEFVQIVGTSRREIALCKECATEQGMAAQIEAFQQLSQAILEQMGSQESLEPTEVPHITCSNCGLKFEEFARKGLLGCEHCYLEFREALAPVIRRLHGVTKSSAPTEHIVAIREISHPENHEDKQIPLPIEETPTKEELELRIELALMEENYELAAALRDKLREL